MVCIGAIDTSSSGRYGSERFIPSVKSALNRLSFAGYRNTTSVHRRKSVREIRSGKEIVNTAVHGSADIVAPTCARTNINVGRLPLFKTTKLRHEKKNQSGGDGLRG